MTGHCSTRFTVSNNLAIVKIGPPTLNCCGSLDCRAKTLGKLLTHPGSALQEQLVKALSSLQDTNFTYTLGGSLNVFAQVDRRPTSAGTPIGFGTNRLFGQDTGDVFAVLTTDYNFDGTQTPVV